MGRDEHPASSSPGMDPHPPRSTAAGTEPAWPSPSGRLHHARCRWFPKGFGGDEVPPSAFPPSLSASAPAPEPHPAARSKQEQLLLHGFSMLMASHCQPPFPLPECSQDGGQGARASTCPPSPCHTPCHPLGQGTSRGQAEGTAPLPVMSCRAAARFPPLIKAALLLHLQHAPLIN